VAVIAPKTTPWGRVWGGGSAPPQRLCPSPEKNNSK